MDEVTKIVSAAGAAHAWAAADAVELKAQQATLPQRFAVAQWVVAELARTVADDDGAEWFAWASQRELADALGIDKSVITHMKKVVGKYPKALPKSAGDTWQAVLKSAYGSGGSGAESVPATSKDKAHAALESDELTNAEFCRVVTAAAGKRSLTAKQRTDLIAMLEG